MEQLDKTEICIDKCEFFLTEYPNTQIALIHVNPVDKESIMHHIIQIMFYSGNMFYSITESEKELSVFVDQRYIDNNILSSFTIKKDYRIIQINEVNDGIDHIGIVNNLSNIFTLNNIPILYINSFNNNFVLIHGDKYNEAMQILRKMNIFICQN
jgi:hypothetical protein